MCLNPAPSLPPVPSFGMDLFLFICCLTLATCTKEWVAERTGSTYEDMPVTGLEKAEKREDKRDAVAASPSSIWKENTFLSHSLPVCWISQFESTRGETHRHMCSHTHSWHLMKAVQNLTKICTHILWIWFCVYNTHWVQPKPGTFLPPY